MVTVGVTARFEFKAGNEAAIVQFFSNGRRVVEGQPETTQWFAHRLGPTTYGAFAVFANDEDREALLAAEGPRASRESAELFLQPPSFEKVDVVATRTADIANTF
jgi:hypothetical protein